GIVLVVREDHRLLCESRAFFLRNVKVSQRAGQIDASKERLQQVRTPFGSVSSRDLIERRVQEVSKGGERGNSESPRELQAGAKDRGQNQTVRDVRTPASDGHRDPVR